MSRAASRPFGICGRCGFRYKLIDLRSEYVDYRETSKRICPTCLDPDHPQNHVEELEVNDPVALRDPRPDLALESSRVVDLTAWNDKYGG